MARPIALTIAGSDPSGGAGLQADLKTFHQFGVYGTAVPTLITVQNTCGVQAVAPLAARLVRQQLEALQADVPPAAAKTGALGNAAIVEVVAAWARSAAVPLVVDPVLASSHGPRLADGDAVAAMAQKLLPRALLATPNLHEAGLLADLAVRDLATMEKAAERISRFGVPNVLVKGGHLAGDAVDLLRFGDEVRVLNAGRIHTHHTHGTGCAYSAAITALLACGRPLTEAVRLAKLFITQAIRTAPGLGRGRGPVNHHARTATD